MDKMTRQGTHDLLDRVLDARGGNGFELNTYSVTGRVFLRVDVGAHSYREALPTTELPDAVRRAKEATDD